MKKRVLLFAFILVFALATVASASIVLTFEGLGDTEQILNYYNGGLGGNGSGPGPNYGITFGSDSLSIISRNAGGTGYVDNLPSGSTCAFFLTGPGDVMNVAAGFDTGFSFYYASPFYAGSVQVYSGLDGTGTLLASLNLPTTAYDSSNPLLWNEWFPIGVSFSGTAESVIFSGTANQIAFDNITLGSETPGAVPIPPSVLLLGSGLLGLAVARMRRS